ncbi:LysR substrate-binding domain-containing protein [Aquabacterium sp.]|uniref:LysR substrate-binding domain-containing protein n=1 Tax=Aquabacterium sp. TaxID=1872578 RepID=UPI002E304FA2|nr:LysR substrate-binding domain-containing protein [Aquabacterium sp.]HEX5311505.1 LysR substrate-binding domain-containing protein [Aquabacterium sp.]
MDLKALRYFVETARQGSFTQAAAHLFVTQSTVSKMVRQLEDEIGQALLIREGRSVRMTDAGRIVFERGQEAIGVMQRLKRDVADLADLARGELTVGIPPMVNLFFPSLIQRFKARHPHIALTIEEAGGQVIEQRVVSGELEVGVTVLPLAEGSPLTFSELGHFPLCLVGTQQSSWARLKHPGLVALHQQPVVMLQDDYSLTRRLRAAFDEAGVVPQVVAQSGQWDFVLSMAMAGMGTALLPSPLLERLQLSSDVVVRSLRAPNLMWQVGQIWMPDRYLSHAARAWLAQTSDQAER